MITRFQKSWPEYSYVVYSKIESICQRWETMPENHINILSELIDYMSEHRDCLFHKDFDFFRCNMARIMLYYYDCGIEKIKPWYRKLFGRNIESDIFGNEYDKYVKYSHYNEDPCPICLLTQEETKNINKRTWVTLPCNHTFHRSCIIKNAVMVYNVRKPSCPLCREDKWYKNRNDLT